MGFKGEKLILDIAVFSISYFTAYKLMSMYIKRSQNINVPVRVDK